MLAWFLMRTALRDLLQPKRVAVAALMIVAPASIAVVVRLALRSSFDGVATYGALASLLVFGFVLPILAVVFGTGVVSQEMEQKTIVYLLTRPVARWRILLTKFAAAWLIVAVTAIFATLLLAAATHQRGQSTGQARLYPEAILAPSELLENLQVPEEAVSEYLRAQLSERTLRRLDAWEPTRQPPPRAVQAVVNDLNRVIERDDKLYDADRFSGVQLPEDVRQLLAEKRVDGERSRLNRWLLEAAYPSIIARSRTTLTQLPRDLLILPLGALAYGAVCLLLATLLPRALIVGLFLAFGWESWVPMLPGNFKLVSVMTYLRALAPHARPETASVGIMSIFSALNPESVPVALAWIVLSAVSSGSLLLASAIFSIREYAPKDDDA